MTADSRLSGMYSSPYGRYLAIVDSGDGRRASAVVWDLQTARSFVVQHTSPVSWAGFSADESILLSGDQNQIIMTSLADQRQVALPNGTGVLHHSGRFFAYGRLRGFAILDLQTRRTREFDGNGLRAVAKLLSSCDGKWLFVGTDRDVSAYDWESLLRESESPPAPVYTSQTSGRKLSFAPRQAVTWHNIYAMAHDSQNNRLLFAGLGNVIHYLNLTSGASGELAPVPGEYDFLALELNADSTALASIVKPALDPKMPNEQKPWRLMIWDYAALVRRAAISDGSVSKRSFER
jgi:hypothetical protein